VARLVEKQAKQGLSTAELKTLDGARGFLLGTADAVKGFSSRVDDAIGYPMSPGARKDLTDRGDALEKSLRGQASAAPSSFGALRQGLTQVEAHCVESNAFRVVDTLVKKASSGALDPADLAALQSAEATLAKWANGLETHRRNFSASAGSRKVEPDVAAFTSQADALVEKLRGQAKTAKDLLPNGGTKPLPKQWFPAMKDTVWAHGRSEANAAFDSVHRLVEKSKAGGLNHLEELELEVATTQLEEAAKALEQVKGVAGKSVPNMSADEGEALKRTAGTLAETLRREAASANQVLSQATTRLPPPGSGASASAAATAPRVAGGSPPPDQFAAADKGHARLTLWPHQPPAVKMSLESDRLVAELRHASIGGGGSRAILADQRVDALVTALREAAPVKIRTGGGQVDVRYLPVVLDARQVTGDSRGLESTLKAVVSQLRAQGCNVPDPKPGDGGLWGVLHQRADSPGAAWTDASGARVRPAIILRGAAQVLNETPLPGAAANTLTDGARRSALGELFALARNREPASMASAPPALRNTLDGDQRRSVVVLSLEGNLSDRGLENLRTLGGEQNPTVFQFGN
jgi:hypothetical protein